MNMFLRKNWISLTVAVVCVALVPGLVSAQQSFSGASKRLQGLESRILGELALVQRVVDDGVYDKFGKVITPPTNASLQGNYDEIVAHAYETPITCAAGKKLIWNTITEAWACIDETDHLVKTFAQNDLPVCTSTQGLTNKTAGGGVLTCVNFPAPVVGDKPAHQWSSTSVRFETDYGVWGSYENLRGPKGATAVCP